MIVFNAKLTIIGRVKVKITRTTVILVAVGIFVLLSGCVRYVPTPRETAPQSPTPEPINLIKPVPEDTTLKAFAPRSSISYVGLQQNSFSRTGWDSWADISVDGKHIVFSSNAQTGNPDIYIKTVNGTALTQKTTSTANDIQPAISPDGKYIAFVSDRNGNYDVYVTNAGANGSLWQVTTTAGDEMRPTWSHDGNKLAYCTKNPTGEWEIWTYDIGTQTRTSLGAGMNPRWHPSKMILVYQRIYAINGKISSSVCTIDEGGRNLRVIAQADKWAAIQPAWSPDGSRIAFSVYTGGGVIEPTTEGSDIYVVNADGTHEIRITEDTGSNWAPTWAIVDGEERIYFTSRRDNHTNIWSVRSVNFGGEQE